VDKTDGPLTVTVMYNSYLVWTAKNKKLK